MRGRSDDAHGLPLTWFSAVAVTEALLAELRRRRNGDGGWPARVGLPSNTESTALALMAFAAAGADGGGERDGATAWLRRHQQGDGRWTFVPGIPLGWWPTGLAAIALGADPANADAVRGAVRSIVEQQARKLPFLTKLVYRFAPESMSVELNPSLNGWPWADGSFSWVEPTCYALLALKRFGDVAGRAGHRRVEEAERMVLDRACAGGGWNYGNSRVMGEDLQPYPDTTAIALLGLQGLGRVPEIDGGLEALGALLDAHASGVSLALAHLAGRAWSAPAPGVGRRLEAWAAAPADLGETRGIALTILALNEGGNPLLLKDRS